MSPPVKFVARLATLCTLVLAVRAALVGSEGLVSGVFSIVFGTLLLLTPFSHPPVVNRVERLEVAESYPRQLLLEGPRAKAWTVFGLFVALLALATIFYPKFHLSHKLEVRAAIGGALFLVGAGMATYRSSASVDSERSTATSVRSLFGFELPKTLKFSTTPKVVFQRKYFWVKLRTNSWQDTNHHGYTVALKTSLLLRQGSRDWTLLENASLEDTRRVAGSLGCTDFQVETLDFTGGLARSEPDYYLATGENVLLSDQSPGDPIREVGLLFRPGFLIVLMLLLLFAPSFYAMLAPPSERALQLQAQREISGLVVKGQQELILADEARDEEGKREHLRIALNSLSEAISQQPQAEPNAYSYRSQVLWELGRHSEAVTDHQKFVSMNGSGLPLVRRIYRSGEYQQALALMDKTFEKREPYSTKSLRGLCYLGLGKADEARAIYEEVKDSSRTNKFLTEFREKMEQYR